jgi:hypothetical protein
MYFYTDDSFMRNRWTNPWTLKPRITLGLNIAESLGKLGFQMSKDSDTGMVWEAENIVLPCPAQHKQQI